MVQEDNRNFVETAAKLVAAYVSQNRITPAELPNLIKQVHLALSTLGKGDQRPSVVALVPAVPIKKSITPEYLISLEDGKHFKTLKRHLTIHYNLTPEQYRAKWSLPPDYPMVAPSYAERRSALAKSAGLGRRRTFVKKRLAR